MTHEFVRWSVGDSYSFGPLCLDCRNSKSGWLSTGLDDPELSDLILGLDHE